MYDWPEVREVTDAFWARAAANLRDAGVDAPGSLTRGADLRKIWTAPDLLVAQTCGLPLVRGECGDALPFALPSYDVPGCAPGTYSSAIIARDEARLTLDDFEGSVLAINGWDSQSGCNALKSTLADRVSENGPFFKRIVVSGAHRRSADLVASGGADLCALDAVAWALYKSSEPARSARLRVLEWTIESPSLPFIMPPDLGDRSDELYRALRDAARSVPACPAIPSDIAPAELSDYDLVRKMDEEVAGVTFAPQDDAHG
ncbi:MAG: PhnD/SsuA/transferrin family substrate-binding protein [Pseudomonadota bacterium]